MSFESFDASMLIENSGFLPQGEPPGTGESTAPTLEGALQQAAAREPSLIDRQAMREAMRNATALDLWVEHTSGIASRALNSFEADQPAPLRKLNPDELALLSGGTGSNFDVVGPGGWDWNFPDNDPGDQYPTGTGSPPSQDPHQITEDAKDTPCVNQVPAGVDKDHLNDLAKYMGSKLADLQDSTGWEWGAFIYRGSDGQLYQSEPFTAQHHDDLIGASIALPPGAHIIGYIHTHPIDFTVDQRNLSQEDRDFINDLVARTGSITADTNLLAYVTTKDGSSNRYFDNYSTFVYDKSERDATEPGCDL